MECSSRPVHGIYKYEKLVFEQRKGKSISKLTKSTLFLNEILYTVESIKAAADERCTEHDYEKDYYNSYCSELFTCEYTKGVIHANKCITGEQWYLRSKCENDFKCKVVLNCYENDVCRENMKCFIDSDIKKKVERENGE